ncbi:MAG: polysaccharide biosynthesis protein, partial [Oscillospiraceae bacterium]
MSKNTQRLMLLQGSILAGAGILTKIIGFAYRIPMANLLGGQGNGIYSVSFGIYNIALTLSYGGLPLAVSKLVAARLAKGQQRNARRVFWDALLFAILVGGAAGLALYFGADFFELLYQREGLAKPLRVLAPTTLVVSILGVLRGWFQGHGNMIPTAMSQIFEQIVNAVVSVVAAWQLMQLYRLSPFVAAYGAAGGTIGTLAGAVTALLVLLYFRMTTRRRVREPLGGQESHALVFRALVLTVLPVILSQTVYQIGYTLDDLIFGNVMAAKGFAGDAIATLQGVFNTQYNQLVNLPVSIATAMAASAVPGIVASNAAGERREAHRKITAVVKFNLAIALPSAVGLAVLATPLMQLLFPRLVTEQAIAARLLQIGSSAAVFYALSTITTAILQAGDHMQVPLRHCAVSLALHVALVFGLLQFTDLGVYALVIGNVSFPLLVSLLNCRAMGRLLGYHWKIARSFGVPLVASLGMGAVTWGSNALLTLLHCPAVAALPLVVLLSIAVYGLLILKLHCFADSQLVELPLGRKLLALSKR